MVLPLDQGPLGEPAFEKSYLPFHAAMQAGVITDPMNMAVETENPIGVDISNGLIPNSKGAGIVTRGNEMLAIDHASVEMRDHALRIMPAAKKAVAHEGTVVQEGAILMAQPDGRIKVAALVINAFEHPWTVEGLRQDRRVHIVGRMAVIHPGWFDLPDFELAEIDDSTGLMVAKERRPQFAFGGSTPASL